MQTKMRNYTRGEIVMSTAAEQACSSTLNASASVELMKRALGMMAGFSEWPEKWIDRLVETAACHSYQNGCYVDLDTVHDLLVIVSGHVMVYLVAEGHPPVPIGLLGPGQFLGPTRTPSEGQDVRYSVLTMGSAVVMQVSSTQLVALLDQQPTLWKATARALLKQQQDFCNAILSASLGTSLKQRLAAILCHFCEKFGTLSPLGWTLRVRLSQQDLADLLQVSRQSVNKELRQLEVDRVLFTLRETIIVYDLAVLRKAASPLLTLPAHSW